MIFRCGLTRICRRARLVLTQPKRPLRTRPPNNRFGQDKGSTSNDKRRLCLTSHIANYFLLLRREAPEKACRVQSAVLTSTDIRSAPHLSQIAHLPALTQRDSLVRFALSATTPAARGWKQIHGLP
jgi:hypothetical protein